MHKGNPCSRVTPVKFTPHPNAAQGKEKNLAGMNLNKTRSDILKEKNRIGKVGNGRFRWRGKICFRFGEGNEEKESYLGKLAKCGSGDLGRKVKQNGIWVSIEGLGIGMTNCLRGGIWG